MEQRPQVRTGKPIRETQVKPKLVWGLFPFFPALISFVLAFWFYWVGGVPFLVVLAVFLTVLGLMSLATMHDAYWCEIGTQKVLSACRRMIRTRGRSLFSPRRKYKAAR